MTSKTIVVLMLLAAAPLGAVAATEPALTAETRHEVVEGLVELLEDLYVIPETAQRLEDMLRENLAGGAYDDETSAPSWAATLTRDLQALSGDKHLRVSFGGEGAMAPQPVRRMPGSGSDGGVFDGVRGIPEAKVLAGNVGYVDIRLFVPLEQEEELAVAAMAAVADVDALVFDLRTCAGGSPDMVHFITSYLYPPEPKHLLTYYHAHTPPEAAYTLAEIPGRRLPDVPVYVVTSPFTGSGCEEFSYVLKHHGRATLVGETTGGAGHGGGVHPIAAGFDAFIPDFRPVHPVTGGGWEGVGVKPTVESPAETAHLVAHRMALAQILDAASDAQPEQELGDLIADLDAQIARANEPVLVDGEALAEFVGEYEIRTITLEDAGLHLQRAGGPKLLMVATEEPDTFTLKRVPQARIRFGRDADGTIVELHVLGMTGNWEVSKRVEANGSLPNAGGQTGPR
jgi:hypothetical protein